MTHPFVWGPPAQVLGAGINLAVYENGAEHGGVPLVFCHGWPELAFSWRHQMEGLAAAGWRCLAPDMRGFGGSQGPPDITAYGMEEICADLAAMLDAYAIDQAIFVGHDFGGLAVWDMARRYPERVAGVVGVCTPHRARLPFEPVAGMRARWGEDFYIVYFQEPGRAEALFEADIDKTFRFLQRSGPQARAAAARAPKDAPFLALQLALAAWDGDPSEPTLLSAAERQIYVDAYRRTGFRGGLNWYRNFTRNWESSAGLPDHVSQPSLMIMAEWDSSLPPSAADAMEAVVPDLEKRLIAQAGHWVQQEQPDAVNGAILDWLSRRFPR